MTDLGVRELSRITEERRCELYNSFMSGSIDFWTDPHRRESYGIMMLDLIAECYHFSSGQKLFMSRKTKSELKNVKFVSNEPFLDHLELPLNFERFDRESKLWFDIM